MRWRNGIWALVALAPLRVIAAQPSEGASPFLVGAASAGLLGFTSGSTPHALIGGYAYAAYPRLIVGAQGGVTPGGGTAEGVLLGFRAGYLFRHGDVGERAIYFSFALGVGGRRRERDEPPVIVAQKAK